MSRKLPSRRGWVSPLAWCVRAEAICLYPIVRQRLAREGARSAVKAVHQWAARGSRASLSATDVAAVTGWVRGIGVRLPWDAKCLDHSLVAWGILCRRDVSARIRLGWQQKPGPGRQESAHAWIEVAGVPIHESKALLTGFTVFEDFDLGTLRESEAPPQEAGVWQEAAG